MALLPLGQPPLGLQAATLALKAAIRAYPGPARVTLRGSTAAREVSVLCCDVMPRHPWLVA